MGVDQPSGVYPSRLDTAHLIQKHEDSICSRPRRTVINPKGMRILSKQAMRVLLPGRWARLHVKEHHGRPHWQWAQHRRGHYSDAADGRPSLSATKLSSMFISCMCRSLLRLALLRMARAASSLPLNRVSLNSRPQGRASMQVYAKNLCKHWLA